MDMVVVTIHITHKPLGQRSKQSMKRPNVNLSLKLELHMTLWRHKVSVENYLIMGVLPARD